MVLTWEKIMIQYKSNNTSLISESETVPIIDLGQHGFADSFYPIELKEIASNTAPLVCCLDKTTGLVQLQNITVAKDRYDLVDYSYTSSNSQFSQEHWIEFFGSVTNKINLKSGHILEIGSNDGYLLSLFKQITSNVVGIDASAAMVREANSRGIDTVHGIFGEAEKLNSNIRDAERKFDAILANNVLNHANNPLEFVKEISLILNKDGVFIFEVPYWYNTISSLRFDQIYLEHITYFTVESLEHLLSTAGLYINEVELVNYHGGSLRVYASFKKECSLNKEKFIVLEDNLKLKDESTYILYVNKVNQVRDNFLKNLARLKEKNPTSTVFGIGAAAKANTLLTYYGLNSQSVEFIVDSSPFKQGKLTPVSLIPIMDDETLTKVSNGIGIILAWNLSNNLKNKLLSINKNIKFLDIL
jgi:SAM-dependent methyltransferase